MSASGTADVVLVCEHASNYIPDGYRGLGLGASDLARHIAWDIGAAEVTRRLSLLLDAPAFLATHSRLLIDLNRPLDAATLIVTRSEATDIPGNIGIDAAERATRIARLFTPFHDAVSGCLDDRQAAGKPVRLVSIHSFTPVFHGVQREWHAGVLFDRAQSLGEAMVAQLQAPGLRVGANVPYKSGRTDDYAVPVHGDDRGIPAILLEIRQDLIADSAGAAAWAGRIAAALTAV